MSELANRAINCATQEEVKDLVNNISKIMMYSKSPGHKVLG